MASKLKNQLHTYPPRASETGCAYPYCLDPVANNIVLDDLNAVIAQTNLADFCLCYEDPERAASNRIDCEILSDVYWYHPDYVGSNELITDITGEPYQYFFYTPFGFQMPDRSFSAGSDQYRYGFNGKESDPELKSGASYDYGFRIYDARIGKFLSVDPLTESYPWYTPYQLSGNSPIRFIDLDGLEEYDIWLDEQFNLTRIVKRTYKEVDLMKSSTRKVFRLFNHRGKQIQPTRRGFLIELEQFKKFSNKQIEFMYWQIDRMDNWGAGSSTTRIDMPDVPEKIYIDNMNDAHSQDQSIKIKPIPIPIMPGTTISDDGKSNFFAAGPFVGYLGVDAISFLQSVADRVNSSSNISQITVNVTLAVGHGTTNQEKWAFANNMELVKNNIVQQLRNMGVDSSVRINVSAYSMDNNVFELDEGESPKDKDNIGIRLDFD